MKLKLRDVHTHIGSYHILHGVSFEVPLGSVTVLLGRNGVGKTTTLRTIMGLWSASSGDIEFSGRSIQALPTPAISTLGIAYVPENMGIFSDLAVKENLLLAAKGAKSIADFDKARVAWILALFPALQTFWEKPAGLLSGGQKQMLAIARAMIEPRELILVDEPTKGLAPAIVKNFGRAIGELKATSTTILMVEQNFHFASLYADHAVIMDAGRVVYANTMAALLSDAATQKHWLGLSL